MTETSKMEKLRLYSRPKGAKKMGTKKNKFCEMFFFQKMRIDLNKTKVKKSGEIKNKRLSFKLPIMSKTLTLGML